MMVKASDIIGADVLTLEKGKKVANVSDILYDPSVGKIKGLVVDTGKLFSDTKVILFEKLSSIGKHAVMIHSEDIVQKISDIDERVAAIAKSSDTLTQTNIVTENGNKLGKVTDVLFDEKTGKVSELEISEGMLKSVSSGHKRIKVEDVVTVGEDATIVRAYTTDELEAQSKKQGLEGTYESAKESVKKAGDTVKSKAQDVKTSAQETYDDVRDQNRQKEMKSKGRQKVQDIREDTEAGIRNVTQKAKVKTRDLAEQTQARSRFQQATDSLTAAGQDVLDTVDKTVKDIRDRTDRTQRETAIGKYLTKNIIGKNDKILAKRGDMVTHSLLSNAEKQGIDDQVIAHTSTEKPSE